MKKKNIFISVGIIIVLVIVALLFILNNRVTVDFNTGTIDTIKSVSIFKNKVVNAPQTPVREGYIFEGWYLNGILFDFDTKITEDITLEGRWRVSQEKYIVSFDSAGGSDIDSIEVKSGYTVNIPDTPTKDGYVFVEWELNGASFDFNSKIVKDLTLVAKWTKKTENTITYMVTFDANGGSEVSSQTIIENGTVTKPANPTRNGYKFIEWQLNGKTYNFSSKVVKKITLVAVWEEKEQYTVSFNTNGGSSVSSKTVYAGDKVDTPANPTKNHYTFIRWELDGTAYDFNRIVNTNITLVAKWTENDKCNVTFNANGGTNVNSKIVYCNEKIGTISTSTRGGFTFDGWYSGNTEYNADSIVRTNIELTAKWINNDELALANAKTAIKDSYNITSGGQDMGVTSSGCEITHVNASDIAQIRRNTTDTEVTLNYNIVCGSKNGTDTATGIIKASTYQYTVEDAGNRTNSYVRIDGLTNYILYAANTNRMIGIHIPTYNGAVVVNDDIENEIDMRLNTDDNTTYVVSAAD